MNRTPTWKYSPRARRTIAEIVAALGERETAAPVALLVGAGLDRALRKRPLWHELIRYLSVEAGFSEPQASALVNVAKRWPVEAAEALRSALGLTRYTDVLKQFVEKEKKNERPRAADAVRDFVEAGVRVIVSLNYTPDLADALRVAGGTTIRVIGPDELSSWNLNPLLSPPPGDVHLIAIHGRIDPASTATPNIVLDQRSYSAATLRNPDYPALLSRLFQDFTVVSFGVSWADVPLRATASSIVFNRPIAARVHAAIFPQGARTDDIWQERAFVNAYGVRLLYYDSAQDHAEASDVLAALASPARKRPLATPLNNDSAFVRVADLLDEWGDYESGPQCNWMVANWSDVRQAILDRALTKIDLKTWLALARIERHLRHFIWFYLPRKQQRVIARNSVWTRIAALANDVPGWPGSESFRFDEALEFWLDRSELDARGFFEFAVGAFEVRYGAEDEPSAEIRRWQAALRGFARGGGDSVHRRRIALAAEIWTPPTELSVRRLGELKQLAIECEWEGVESKLALDIVQKSFADAARKTGGLPRTWSESVRQEIAAAAENARIVARTAGCLRREVGSVVTGSFTAPAQIAETDLLAIHERFTATKSRATENSMLWWVYAGLLAVFYDTRKERDATSEQALRWLEERCGKIKYPAHRSTLGAVTLNSIPHWGTFHKPAAEIALKLANSQSG